MSGEARLDARAVFAISLGENRIIQRPIYNAPGTVVEVANQEGQMLLTPTALVDLTAADGGFGEWYEHVWMKKLGELRKVADDAIEAEGQQATALL